MIALSGTFTERESCDQTKSMIALSGTFKARESAIKQRVNQRPLAAPRWEKIVITAGDFGESYLLIQQNCYFHGR
jgi:hypothetical protein